MRLRRRAVPFSSAAALERVWFRKKRVTFAQLLADFPGLSKAVLSRNLKTLGALELVRTRLVPRPGRSGRAPRYWRVTPRGLEVLRLLQPYRDFWGCLEGRELNSVAAAVKTFGRLEAVRISMFPGTPDQRPRWDYWIGRKNPEPQARALAVPPPPPAPGV